MCHVNQSIAHSILIAGEKYKLAKQIKDCIAELLQVRCSHGNSFIRDGVTIKVGEELAGYEVQKREAIQREDYNLAEEKRSQSEACRQQAFKRLHLSALLTESDALDEDVPTQQPVVDNNAVVELQPIKMQGDPKVLHCTSGQQYENHDDRPLPTLDKCVILSVHLFYTILRQDCQQSVYCLYSPYCTWSRCFV